MAEVQQVRDAIAAEKQQFEDYKNGKEAEVNALNLQLTDANNTIAQKDQQIADLQNQLANASNNIPDDIITDIQGIVP